MRPIFLIAPIAVCSLSSCKDNEVRTYKVATDSDAPVADAAPHSVDPIGAAPKPEEEKPHDHAAHSNSITWRAGDGWTQEQAGQFLTAAYALPEGGRVTVSKLGGDGGGLAANVNRWRGQVGLQPLEEDKIGGQPMKIADSAEGMLLYNLIPPHAADDAEGIFAAVLPLASETWYFKFTGPSAVLNKSGGKFMDFLRTVRVPASSSTSTPPPAAGAEKNPQIKVIPPESWTPSEGSAMRAASYTIPGPDGSLADVSVIPLPGDSGSVLDNVNRWRSQVQLAPLDSETDPELGKTVSGPAGDYFLSHMVSTEPLLEEKKAAIGSAIMKKEGMTWFFKVTGEAPHIEAIMPEFEAFVRSATFP